MFRCYFCEQITPPKTKRHNVVIATRERSYPSRRNESKQPRGRFRMRETPVQDRGGSGMETAQEVPACPACAAKQHEVETISIPGSTRTPEIQSAEVEVAEVEVAEVEVTEVEVAEVGVGEVEVAMVDGSKVEATPTPESNE